MSHTILLIQPTSQPRSRTWSDYETLPECLDGIRNIFVANLKNSLSCHSINSMLNDVSELVDFIDGLSDMSCLVYSKNSLTYEPHNKDWIKEQLISLLKGGIRNREMKRHRPKFANESPGMESRKAEAEAAAEAASTFHSRRAFVGLEGREARREKVRSLLAEFFALKGKDAGWKPRCRIMGKVPHPLFKGWERWVGARIRDGELQFANYDRCHEWLTPWYEIFPYRMCETPLQRKTKEAHFAGAVSAIQEAIQDAQRSYGGAEDDVKVEAERLLRKGKCLEEVVSVGVEKLLAQMGPAMRSLKGRSSPISTSDLGKVSFRGWARAAGQAEAMAEPGIPWPMPNSLPLSQAMLEAITSCQTVWSLRAGSVVSHWLAGSGRARPGKGEKGMGRPGCFRKLRGPIAFPHTPDINTLVSKAESKAAEARANEAAVAEDEAAVVEEAGGGAGSSGSEESDGEISVEEDDGDDGGVGSGGEEGRSSKKKAKKGKKKRKLPMYVSGLRCGGVEMNVFLDQVVRRWNLRVRLIIKHDKASGGKSTVEAASCRCDWVSFPWDEDLGTSLDKLMPILHWLWLIGYLLSRPLDLLRAIQSQSSETECLIKPITETKHGVPSVPRHGLHFRSRLQTNAASAVEGLLVSLESRLRRRLCAPLPDDKGEQEAHLRHQHHYLQPHHQPLPHPRHPRPLLHLILRACLSPFRLAQAQNTITVSLPRHRSHHHHRPHHHHPHHQSHHIPHLSSTAPTFFAFHSLL